ncbi:MAG TPA: GDP-mannose 4,6-dehydratase [Terriglobales bacterium]|nr:GDP-mannose 4,6-dehydratase [Terriglobales bacterium]
MKKTESFRSVLIFGGAGFIGSNWARCLLANTDAKVHIYDNLSRQGVRHNLAELQSIAGRSGRLQITIGDVRNSAMVERAVRSATEIYHFAAQVAVTTSVSDPRTDFEVNMGGTFNILEAIRKSDRRPFLLFTSTNKVYGELNSYRLIASATRYGYADVWGVPESQPLDFHSPYGCSKGAADQYVHDYARIFKIPTVVFRMSCIAGPHQFGNEDQGWVAHFLYSALSGSPVYIYGDGRQVRDILCVDDLLRAFEAAREHRANTAGQVYNVGGGQGNTASLLELITEIRRLTGRTLQYQLSPMRPGDQLVYVTDFSKLRRDTGWKPQISLPETLEAMYEWWRRNRELFTPAAVAERLPGTSLEHVPEVAA